MGIWIHIDIRSRKLTVDAQVMKNLERRRKTWKPVEKKSCHGLVLKLYKKNCTSDTTEVRLYIGIDYFLLNICNMTEPFKPDLPRF